MKKIGFVLLMSLFAVGCVTTVGPGEAGIKFSKAGSDKGINDMTLAHGWVWHGPGTEVIVFPTVLQTVKWTADLNEGSPSNQEITFQASAGESFSADVSVSFAVSRENVVGLYKTFKMNDLDVLADNYIRDRTRDVINRLSVEYTAAELAGPGRPELQDKAKVELAKNLAEKGITLKELSFLGKFRYPKTIRQALEKATQQIQAARAAKEKIKVAEAEAKQAVKRAEGQAEAARKKAAGQADAILIKAEADAKALKIRMEADREYYKMLDRHVTTQVLKYQRVKRWNGNLPRVVGNGNNGLLLNVSPGGK